MGEQKPWSTGEINALYGNVERKLAIGAMELFETYQEMHPEIDFENMTDEQSQDWKQFCDSILARYKADKYRSIARLDRFDRQES